MFPDILILVALAIAGMISIAYFQRERRCGKCGQDLKASKQKRSLRQRLIEWLTPDEAISEKSEKGITTTKS